MNTLVHIGWPPYAFLVGLALVALGLTLGGLRRGR